MCDKPIYSCAETTNPFIFALNKKKKPTNAYLETAYNHTPAITHPECKINAAIYEQFPHIDTLINVCLGIIGYCVPCLLALILDIMLIHTIRHKAMFNQSNGTFLLTFSAVYLLCYIPYSVVFLLLSVDVSIDVNIIVLVTHLRYFNHVITFYIYLATGKTFRSDLAELFFGRRRARCSGKATGSQCCNTNLESGKRLATTLPT